MCPHQAANPVPCAASACTATADRLIGTLGGRKAVDAGVTAAG
jgi:hypothetical protein